MKMGKLSSSIATATMVLTTLAPAAVANAATGYPLTNDGVSSTQSNSASLPAATYNSENSNSGSATATSDASVNVVDGYLILQSVPNFGFGAAVAGNYANLVNYDSAKQGVNDGNTDGLLTILDSRHSSKEAGSPQDGMGFALTLALGGFSHNDNGTTAPTRPDTDKFSLHFVRNAKGLQEILNKNNTHSARLTAKSIDIEEGTTGSQPLVTADSGKSGGNHTWKFGGNDVNLYVPASAVKGQWYATMTWTLNASAS